LFKLWRKYTHREVISKYFGQANDNRAYGFKVMYNDGLDYDLILNSFPDVKIVHLRRNPLRRIVSDYFNNQKGKTGRSAHSTSKGKIVRLRVDPAFFKDRLYKDREYVKKYAWADEFLVRYERLVSNTEQELDRIQEYIGVPSRTLTSGLVKQNPKQLSEYVKNLDEIKSLL
jgi:hypothetical protein